MIRLFTRTKPRRAETADTGRRSFLTTIGAGVSAALGSTAAIAGSGGADGAARQVALLEQEKALRSLQQQFEQALDEGRYDDVVAMFADDAEVVFNGGVFENGRGGVSRLYQSRFPAAQTGRRMEQAPGFEVTADALQDSVDIAPDLLSATAVFPYSIRVGALIESETSHASMARLQGGGVQTWWEGGLYKVRFIRSTADSHWQIGRLEYAALSRADYRPGRSHARPMASALLTDRFPADPLGPDRLV